MTDAPTLDHRCAADRRRRRAATTSSTRSSSTIDPGEVLGLVGESGSGKTTVGLAVLGHARKGVPIASGSSRRSATASMLGSRASAQLRRSRGELVSYVPQDPSTALNPALRIGTQLLEVLEAHDFGGSDERPARPRAAR